ncbi:uncharacterized protein PFL1_00947 [Pseudozyma flocculosa PF-1]|uniref:HMG box domain-containing protein n=1 Tax=Pseudozyma flocculosa TaxID=84751 RepID=A0A5C3F8C8_9BASI|nr:uncharacterized protein PFL1_00947 [Pseudozyma flocculosa PF-1]EPQ31614.1 hypothetical protein PFL1_00947 [Pseudozyma flocculosa PF-1]SPO40728.1 uncharacterized protein PSFLO_06210 [Pseudozyma flocculosa]
MFPLALLTRAATRPLSAQLPSLARAVSLPRATASFATAATKTATRASASSSSTPKPKRAASKKAAGSSTKKAATKKPKAAPKKKAPKKEPKLKPWQARGADGKLLPLPSATKPTLRSTFIIYMAERLPTFMNKPEFSKPSARSDKPVLDIIKASKQIGEEWKSLPASDKKKYEDIHEKEKAEYTKALAHWKASLTPEDIRRQNAYISAQRKKGIKGTALLRDPAKPKRPNSAFFEYLAELRAQDSTGASATEIARKGGEKWKSMSPSSRAPYEQKAAGALEQYKKDLDDYVRAKEAQL